MKVYFSYSLLKSLQKYIMIPIDIVFLRKPHSENLEKRCPRKNPAAKSVLPARSQGYRDDSVSAQMQCDGGDNLL